MNMFNPTDVCFYPMHFSLCISGGDSKCKTYCLDWTIVKSCVSVQELQPELCEGCWKSCSPKKLNHPHIACISQLYAGTWEAEHMLWAPSSVPGREAVSVQWPQLVTWGSLTQKARCYKAEHHRCSTGSTQPSVSLCRRLVKCLNWDTVKGHSLEKATSCRLQWFLLFISTHLPWSSKSWAALSFSMLRLFILTALGLSSGGVAALSFSWMNVFLLFLIQRMFAALNL